MSEGVRLYDANGVPHSVQDGVATPVGTPALLIAGSDGADTRVLRTDTASRPVVVGAGVAGTPAGGVVSVQGVAGGSAVATQQGVAIYQGTVSATGVPAGLDALDASTYGFVDIHVQGTSFPSTITAVIAVEGTDNPAAGPGDGPGVNGWAALTILSASSGARSSSIVLPGRYVITNPPRKIRVRCTSFTSGSAQVDLLLKSDSGQSPARWISDADGLARWALTTFGSGIVAQKTFLVGDEFAESASLDTSIWTDGSINGGSLVFANGEVELNTGVAPDGRARITSIRKANFLGGHDNEIACVVRQGDTGGADHLFRFGVYDDDNGVFIEVMSTGITFKTRKGGVDSPSVFGVLGLAPVQNNTNNQFWFLKFNPNFILFYQGSGLVQILLGSVAVSPLFNKVDLPLRAEAINLSGAASHSLYVQTLVANRLGPPATVRANQSFAADDVLSAVAATIHGQLPDSSFDQVQLDLDSNLQVSARQIPDPNNTVAITSVSATGNAPGNPWVGTPFATLSRNIHENLTVVAAFDGSGPLSSLGGTLTFRYWPEPPLAPIVEETRTIREFSTVRATGWLSNPVAAYYSVEFEPDRPLVVGETVVVSTGHSKFTGNDFKRLPDQVLEEENQAGTVLYALLKAFKDNGDSVNIGSTDTEDLRVGFQSFFDSVNSTTGTVVAAYLGTKFIDEANLSSYVGGPLPAIPADTFIGSSWVSCANFANFAIDASVSTGRFGQVYAIFSTDGGATISHIDTIVFAGAGAFSDPIHGATHFRVAFQNRSTAGTATFRSHVQLRYQAQGLFSAPARVPVDGSVSTALVKSVGTALPPDGSTDASIPYADVLGPGYVSAQAKLAGGLYPPTDALGAGGTDTTPWRAWSGYGGLFLTYFSNVATAALGLIVEFTEDDPALGTPVVHGSVAITYSQVDDLFRRAFPRQAFAYRVRVINGAVAQTVRRQRCYLYDADPGAPQSRLDATISDANLAVMGRSILAGRRPSPATDFENVGTDGMGRLLTNVGSGFSRLLQRAVENNERLKLDVEPTTTIAGSITDGTTNATTTIGSAGGQFKTWMRGAGITGTNIPLGATIVTVTSATSAVISIAATGTGSGIPFTTSQTANFLGKCPETSFDGDATHSVVLITYSSTRNPTTILYRENVAWSARGTGWT